MRKKKFTETYINPLTDFGFKLIFGKKKNKRLLIDFLNEIIEEQNIVDIEYQPTFQIGNTEHNRKAVFDICCKNEKGEFFVVEMQKVKQSHFADRSLYYSSFPIQNQAPQGNWNFELKAVYTVALLDFVLFEDVDDGHDFQVEHIYLTRERTKTRYSRKLNLIFIELPKFRKTLEEVENKVDGWLFSLKNLPNLSERPAALQDKIFEQLFKAAEIKKLTGKEMETYNKSILEYDDVRDAVDFAKEEFFAKGISQGITKGISQGMAKGIIKGKKSREYEIARNLLNLRIPILDIAKATGLTPEQIIEL